MARQFLRGPRLANAGLAGEHDDPTLSCAGLLECVQQHFELALSPDKGVGRLGHGSPRKADLEAGLSLLSRRRRNMSCDRDAVDMQRPGDVLDPLLASVLEGNVELVADLVAHHPADAD